MDLENMDEKINDEDHAMLLLCTLPLSYKYFRKTLIYSRDDIYMNGVKSSLFSKDLMEKELTGATTSDGKAEASKKENR